MPTTQHDQVPSRSTLQQYERDLKVIQQAYGAVTRATVVSPGSGGIPAGFTPGGAHRDSRTLALARQREALEALIRDGWAARSPLLPTDIVQSTLDNFIRYEAKSASLPSFKLRSFLMGLCLVCKAWLAPARRVLYHDISLSHDSWNTEPFLQTVRTTPAIRNFVRHITGRLNDFVDATWLSLLPNCTAELQVLILHPDDPHNVWEKVVAQDLKELKKITIFSDDAEYEPVGGSLRTFSHLETLELGGYGYYVGDFPFAPGFRNIFFASLAVLKLADCQHMELPRISPNTLREITLQDCQDIDAVSFVNFIRQHSTSLLDITVSSTTFSSHDGMDVFVEIARTAKCAQRLEVDISEWRTSSDFFSSVPSSLIELHLCEDDESSTHLDMIRLMDRQIILDHRHLKLVTIKLRKARYEEGVRKWEAVKVSAGAVGVAFSIWWSGEWLPHV
jgi:hypothetical protein